MENVLKKRFEAARAEQDKKQGESLQELLRDHRSSRIAEIFIENITGRGKDVANAIYNSESLDDLDQFYLGDLKEKIDRVKNVSDTLKERDVFKNLNLASPYFESIRKLLKTESIEDLIAGNDDIFALLLVKDPDRFDSFEKLVDQFKQITKDIEIRQKKVDDFSKKYDIPGYLIEEAMQETDTNKRKEKINEIINGRLGKYVRHVRFEDEAAIREGVKNFAAETDTVFTNVSNQTSIVATDLEGIITGSDEFKSLLGRRISTLLQGKTVSDSEATTSFSEAVDRREETQDKVETKEEDFFAYWKEFKNKKARVRKPNATPQEIKDWWKNLSPDQIDNFRDEFITEQKTSYPQRLKSEFESKHKKSQGFWFDLLKDVIGSVFTSVSLDNLDKSKFK